MKQIRPLLTLALLLATIACLPAQVTKDFPTIEQMLPAQTTPMDIMRSVESKEWVADIDKKMAKAVNANRAWLVDYVKKNRAIKPLPYHANFGVTREEYDRYNYSRARTVSQKLGEITMKVVREGDFVELSFDEGQVAADTPAQKAMRIQPLRIDVFTGELRTPQLKIIAPLEHSSQDKANPIGPVQAYIWSDHAGSPAAGNLAATILTIGRNTETGRGFIHYIVSKVGADGVILDRAILLYFTPPPVKGTATAP